MNQLDLSRSLQLDSPIGDCYQGDAVVHWTLFIAHRRQGWLNDSFHAQFRELMLHAAAREGLVCPVYCLVPDHLHFIWMGLRPDCDQRNGMTFLRAQLKPLIAPLKFQQQAHGHVLKPYERRRGAFAGICNHILENPLRAELVATPAEWPFSGAIAPGYPALHPLQDNFWPVFGKLYARLKHPAAREVTPAPTW